LGNGNGTFSDVAASAGLHLYASTFGRSCSFVDVDDDGDLDAYIAIYGNPPDGLGTVSELYHNRLTELGAASFVLNTPDLLKGDPLRLKTDATWADFDKDGKAFRPDGKQAGTIIPNAFGLAGVNNHTWTGGWGDVTYWNAYVAATEMHGSGTFFDARLNDKKQYPVAAKTGSGNTRGTPDVVTAKLAALHFYQIAIPAPKPAKVLNPAFDIDGASYLMATQFLATVPHRTMGKEVLSLQEEASTIVNALDCLFQGI
jgi:hypothetical protein